MNARLSLAVAALILPAVAVAQTGAPIHLRGNVVAATSTSLTLRTDGGTEGTIALPPGYRLIGVKAAKLSDVKIGGFVGVGSVPNSSGGQNAVEVTIFPPAMAGTGEGSYPWAMAPQGTMTNATVRSTVKTVSADHLTLVYKGGQRTIDVLPRTPIVAISPATTADLKPGVAVSIRGTQDASGTVIAKFVIVGLGGTVPPV
ncbi:hypothetical protein [Solirhodobacter olei]|uniref:hypothetical protein n=1 Tax=Solirhodobacter olei TaxID=2493082 RepID=UPI000FD82384|nr:hypothetical protein [Solirhodobacter olei]